MHATAQYRFVTALTVVFACLLGAPAGWTQQVPKLPAVDVEATRQKAGEGNAEAAYILGTAFFHGRGVERDYTKAVAAFTRAAELGSAMAQWHLGELYAEGTKVPENDAQAFRWFMAAALQGIAAAQFGLGQRYLEGRGTPANPREAARWLREAAMQGYAAAQHGLGLLYTKGAGVEKDLAVAYEWMILAAAQNYPEAIGDRDTLRAQLSEADRTRAQDNAAAFRPRAHFNRSELTRQLEAIKQCAAALPRNQN
jgi:uncharacterized protein